MNSPHRISPARPLSLVLALLAGAGVGAAVAEILHWRAQPPAASPVDDATLLERVRVAMRSVIPDPRGVNVRVRSGVVFLRGPVRCDQIAELAACASRVAGVRAVENRLSVNG